MTEHAEQGAAAPPDEGLWLSVTELAERKGVRKSTISEKLKRLVAEQRVRVKPGPGKAKLINVAEYDIAVGEVGDGARELGAATKAADAGRTTAPSAPRATVDGRLRDEQTREKAYAADLKFLELERARGNLLPIAEFDAVADEAASRIADIVDSLQARDSELTAIAVREGENGMRAALKRTVRAQREAIVRAMRDMAIAVRARAASAAAGVAVQAEMPLSHDDPVPADSV
ncbi:hypothetical protein JQ633_12515 [Bradyrhizobium tropiciagri]|uniref:hypothetical protein n=1 Tax=Bradyrhizobium tropiciagri TaxID=312253 RepID=UPI001BAA039D|nr:hypothetical protein [Bradyrhizobium tropiciagri]MBR0871186.1 hypothetical protein [Bradyrhizobium tropiciagri]